MKSRSGEVPIASKVYISDQSHGMIDAQSLSESPIMSYLFPKGLFHIGKRVWIGEGESISLGVTVGENIIIGANSVFTKDIPANAVAARNPARIIKYLTD